MNTLKCLIVDDERLARSLVKEYVDLLPFLEWVASCKNAFEAMELLNREKIDLMFLDIQMPGMLGTNFLANLKEKPMVILITAYENYAVESYDYDVIDYVMKPVSLERFTKAAYKALHQYTKTQGSKSHETKSTEDSSQDSFFVHVEYSLVKINIKEITHIEGMKDYVKIFQSHTEKPILTKLSLKGIEEKLTGKRFLRVHKSFIVQLDKIDSIRNQSIFIGKHEIPVSKSKVDELHDTLRRF